jgi:hypothetical protein
MDGQAEDGVIEGTVGIIGKVAVRVALDHRQPARHTGVDALAGNLDAAPVDVLGVGQQLQQRAVAAADVEHARPALDHFGDQQVIDAMRARALRCQHQLVSRFRRSTHLEASVPSELRNQKGH